MSNRTYRRLGLAAGLALMLALVAWAGWRYLIDRVAAVVDPREAAVTPFRNVRPEVRYVGDATCAECHARHAISYRAHPMGRSLAPVAAIERHAMDRPLEAEGFQYQVEHQDGHVVHRETCRDAQGQPLAESRAEIAFEIGSGARAHSYLINRDGFLYQSPLTWYAQKARWDLSPGYRGRRVGFARPIRHDCLFCHANQAEPVEHTINRYTPAVFQGHAIGGHAIGCERCHGPGELHAARHQRGEAVEGPDHTIVNPAHLTAPLREAICQQCHLQGASRVVRRGLKTFDFRPGLPLHDFWSVFVRPPELADHLLVSQVEQMHESRCYINSREPAKLGCISCHDPHATPAPEKKVVFYRSRCLQCHEEPSCRLAPAERRKTVPGDSCIECHMPRRPTADISHTAVTDHRIVRRPSKSEGAVASRRLRPGEVPLTHFHRELADPRDPEMPRDLGLALVELAREDSPVRAQLSETALQLLDQALRRAPDDVVAWEARAQALWLQGRRAEALTSSERALALVPEREQSLLDAAAYAEELGQPAAAIAYWERAKAVNPWAITPRGRLARLWSETRAWDKALAECRDVLRVHPANIEARLILVAHHLETGDQARAQAEFDTVLALHPLNPEALRRWYAGKVK